MPSVPYDLIIIGGGYWGTGIALEAEKKGWRVIVIDDKDSLSGSRNASAVCDPQAYRSKIFAKYLPSSWTPNDLTESFNWLLQHGGYRQKEWFLNSFNGTPPRVGTEAIYLKDNSTLLSLVKPLIGKVTGGSFEGGQWILNLENSPRVISKWLVVAAGVHTDKVLTSLGLPTIGVSPLFGRGLLVSGNAGEDIPLPISVMIRPYCKHTIRRWGNYYRVGDTAEKQEGEKAKEALETVGKRVLEDYRELKLIQGYRPVTDKFLVEKVGPEIVVATGGHRLGLGLTGLVAKKTLEALC